YYMEALDKDGQAKFVGYRVMAYRISMMTGTGIIVTIGTNFNWSLAFTAAALIFGIFFLYHLFFLKEVEEQKKPVKSLFLQVLKIKTLILFILIISMIIAIRFFFQSHLYTRLKDSFPILKKFYFSHWIALLLLISLILVGVFGNKIKSFILRDPDSYYARAFITFMERDKIGIILAFIILMRAGEWALTTMVAPFFVDLGIKAHYGWLSGLVGLPAAIIGALLGGWLISRQGLKKMLWPFLLAQNITNLVYMILASHLSRFVTINTGIENPISIGGANLILVGLVHGFDQFASGLGNAVLMTFLMRICHHDFKAAHYAIGSGLMNVSSIFAGVMSGFIASWLGYTWLFGVSFLISVPAMILIPFLPYLSDQPEHKLNE
ncbi:MAG: MFS transporter, partial [Candidatus Aminicenantes bacterium]|nr:MFS transporter [Candidatus Aminicenantes bacterium]